MKKISIVNAYGQKNLGDSAIQLSAFILLNEILDTKDIINLITVDTIKYVPDIKIKPLLKQYTDPYGYAIATRKGRYKNLQKVIRFVHMIFGSFIYMFLSKINEKLLPKKGNFSYIRAIYNSDTVIGMGGGYYITKRKYSDYFGLILTLLPLIISNFYNKKIVILPISYGPFASRIHEKLVSFVLKGHLVISRDNISLDKLKKSNRHTSAKTYYAPDLALFLNEDYHTQKNKIKSNYYILTARDWFLDIKKQYDYEKELAQFADYIWDTQKLKTYFIPMSINKNEDNDNENASRIYEYIKNKKAFKIYNANNIDDLISVINKARFSVCTRMHSAIISVVTKTPFIAIGYGHKTLGFAKSIGVMPWYIDIVGMNANKLILKSRKLMNSKNYLEYVKKLNQELGKKRIIRKKIKRDLISSINI